MTLRQHKGVDISLTGVQIDYCHQLARMHVAKADRLGLSEAGSIRPDREQRAADGYRAEQAFNNYAPWVAWHSPKLPDPGGPDFADNIDVKATDWGGNLIVANDVLHERWYYVLAWLSTKQDHVRLVGWLPGWRIKHPMYWRPSLPKPAYLVPYDHLATMGSLKLPEKGSR